MRWWRVRGGFDGRRGRRVCADVRVSEDSVCMQDLPFEQFVFEPTLVKDVALVWLYDEQNVRAAER